MRRLLLLAALLASCSAENVLAPRILSFTADNMSPAAGEQTLLRFEVKGNARITLTPPGIEVKSPHPVTITATTTFTLKAENKAGSASQDLTLNLAGAPEILLFTASPAQAPAGATVTLSWQVSDALHLSLSGGSFDATKDLAGQTSATDLPGSTTTYTLTATGAPGLPTATAKAVARVAPATQISSFSASPSAAGQGDPVLLSWTGSASGWSVGDGTTTTRLGGLRSLTVRPSTTTTYTLTGTGPGGTATRSIAVTVTARPGTTLAYAEPAPAAQKLKLTADPCPSPCTAITLRLVATAPVGLRGVALDLPLDSTKVSVSGFGVNPAVIPDAAAAKAVLGAGPLRDTLVLGAAREGTGTAPAADSALSAGAEVAHVVLSLLPAGGQGLVFDGAALAGSPAFKAVIQGASGRTAGAIAVGALEVR